MSEIKRVEAALHALKSGKAIILIDDPDRENEGDLIIAAEHINVQNMNFMIRHGTGIICLSLPGDQLKKLELPQMVAHHDNTSFRGTPFTVSIDAKEGITTGVSAHDRVKTILAAIDDHAEAEDLVKPGHVFPLEARAGGVLEREGHTEGALDLVKLAGLKAAAVLSEIMNPDGSMMRGKELMAFAESHQLPLLSIADLIFYRLMHDNLIADEAVTNLPIASYGLFQMRVIREKFTQQEHIILSKENIDKTIPPLVRIHSSCQTGDLFASTRCDCHAQLHYALEKISTEGGLLIYLNQEGRGIGLFNKIKAYALQEKGLDTVDANLELGLPIDAREYYIAAHILRKLDMNHITLLTNNPQKVTSLQKYGIAITRKTIPVFQTDMNKKYLLAKKEKMHQAISL